MKFILDSQRFRNNFNKWCVTLQMYLESEVFNTEIVTNFVIFPVRVFKLQKSHYDGLPRGGNDAGK